MANSISAGYYIKRGIAGGNEDLFYLSVFITVSAKSLKELIWRRQQFTDMLRSMDIFVSDCRFEQEAALRTVMPFVQISPSLERKSKRNVLTGGAASTYLPTSFELSDEHGVLLGVNQYNNSLCIIDLFDTKKNKNANMNLIGTSGTGKTFTCSFSHSECGCAACNVIRSRPSKAMNFVVPAIRSAGVLSGSRPGRRAASISWRSDIP